MVDLSKAKNVMSDKRSRKIILMAHCVLNQNSRVSGLGERGGAVNEVVEVLTQKGIGIVQLPCPELIYAGLSRPPQTKEQYDTPVYRKLCRKFAAEITSQIQEYEKCGVRLKLVIGVEGSPTCSVNKPSGIFTEELHKALTKKGFSAPFFGVDIKHLRDDLSKLEKLLR